MIELYYHIALAWLCWQSFFGVHFSLSDEICTAFDFHFHRLWLTYGVCSLISRVANRKLKTVQICRQFKKFVVLKIFHPAKSRSRHKREYLSNIQCTCRSIHIYLYAHTDANTQIQVYAQIHRWIPMVFHSWTVKKNNKHTHIHTERKRTEIWTQLQILSKPTNTWRIRTHAHTHRICLIVLSISPNVNLFISSERCCCCCCCCWFVFCFSFLSVI